MSNGHEGMERSAPGLAAKRQQWMHFADLLALAVYGVAGIFCYTWRPDLPPASKSAGPAVSFTC